MKKYFLTALLLFASIAVFSQTQGFIRRYDGSIGKQSVVASLNVIDTTIEGSYYYVKIAQPILLTGTIKNGSVSINEVFNDSTIGIFSGTATPDFSAIKGDRRNSPTANSISFNWKQSKAQGSAELGVVNRNHEYIWKTNKKGDHLGVTADYSYCYITGLEDPAVKNKINDELLEGAASDTDVASLKDAALDLMEDDFSNYQDGFDSAFVNANTEQDQKFMEESPQVYQWQQQSAWEVLFNENYLLTIRAFYYEFTGGAHGNYSFSNIVFSLKTGDQISLDTLFKAGYEKSMKQLALAQLERQFKAPSVDELKKQGFFLDHEFELSDNFFIQKNGIGFTYNPYEIAPYSFGSIDILIPWSSLQSWIKPDGPLAWAIIKK